jgi:hypothetical protein
MVYVLIVMWYGFGSSWAGKAALSVEFNSREACQAAASEIYKQRPQGAEIGALVCAAKGQPLPKETK